MRGTGFRSSCLAHIDTQEPEGEHIHTIMLEINGKGFTLILGILVVDNIAITIIKV